MKQKKRVFVVENDGDIERLAHAQGVAVISIGHAYDGDPNLAWLAQQPPLAGLILYGDCRVDAAINGYPHAGRLEELHLGHRASGDIPWHRLPTVTRLHLDSDQQEAWLTSASPALTELTVIDYNQRDLSLLVRLTELQTLEVGARRRLTSLAGAEKLEQLRVLTVQATSALSSFAHLPRNLTTLGLTGCRGLRNLDALADTTMLQHLWLDDCGGIANVALLEDLPELREVDLLGDTFVLDGRLQHLIDRLGTRAVRFVPRRHYDVEIDPRAQ